MKCGESMEQEQHEVTSCPRYEDLRQKYDHLENEKKLAAFFKKALARRNVYDKKQKEAEGKN